MTITTLTVLERVAAINSKAFNYCRGSMSPFAGDNACGILSDGIKADKELSDLYLRGLIKIVCESEYYAPRIETV